MKKSVLFVLFAAMIAGGSMLTACSSDDVDDAPANYLEKVGNIDHEKGVIHYDAAIKNWYVCTFDSDGREDVRYNIINEISTDYQQENLIVDFSGETRKWVERYDWLPMTDYLAIYISDIGSVNTNID